MNFDRKINAIDFPTAVRNIKVLSSVSHQINLKPQIKNLTSQFCTLSSSAFIKGIRYHRHQNDGSPHIKS